MLEGGRLPARLRDYPDMAFGGLLFLLLGIAADVYLMAHAAMSHLSQDIILGAIYCLLLAPGLFMLGSWQAKDRAGSDVDGAAWGAGCFAIVLGASL